MIPRIDANAVSHLAAEADRELRGLALRAVLGGGDPYLLLFGPSDSRTVGTLLRVVLAPKRARAHLSRRREDDPRGPGDAFARELHRRRKGAAVARVSPAPRDRILTLALDRAGDVWTIVMELFGAAPVMALVDPGGGIATCNVRRRGSRPIAPGVPYVPPRPVAAGAGFGEVEAPTGADDARSGSSSWSAAIDAAYEPLDRAERERAERDRLSRDIRAEIARCARLADALRTQLEEARSSERLRRFGDLLVSSFARLRRGQDHAVVEDHYAGGEVSIPLDPALTPRENVERYYRRSRRLERVRVEVGPRLAASERMLGELRELERLAASAPAPGDVRERLKKLTSRPERARGRPIKGLRGEDRERAERMRRFFTRSGLEILVGRSAEESDFLLRRVARGSDHWFHVLGDRGGHAILRLPKGRPPAPEDLEDAAALAVHFSRRRGSSGAEVQHTPRRHVRKVKGGAPGQVRVDRYKTLRVLPDEKRLRRLLASGYTKNSDG